MESTRILRSLTVLTVALLTAHCSSDAAPDGAATGSDAGADATTGGAADAATGLPDASAPDGAAPITDAGAPADAADAAPVDPCAGRIVCDDFEKGTASGKPSAPWAVQASKGAATIDETRAHSGKRSLKVHIDATATNDTYRQAMIAVTGAPLIPLANNTVFGRFMIWTDRVPDKTVHYTFAGGSGMVGANYAVYNYGGMGGLMANYYRNTTPDPTDCWQTKDVPFPTGAWKCVAFELDGKKSEMHFALDGVDVPELYVIGPAKTDQTCTVKGVDGRWMAPTFDSVRVGWESYQHDVAGAHDAWIDDVILDATAIPCPP